MFLKYKNLYEKMLFENSSIDIILSKYSQNISNDNLDNNLSNKQIELITERGWTMLYQNSKEEVNV